jgi:hypothetical protein
VDTETPRPEKLVVDFDTTVNSSPTDISGQGNHGAFYGTNMNYSSADKAFVFNGSDDYIDAALPPEFDDDPTLTISIWVNPDSLGGGSGWNTSIHLGENSGDNQIQLTYNAGAGYLMIGGYNQSMRTGDASALPVGQWTHLCAVITPGAWSATTKKLYINGEFYPTTLSGSGTTSIPAPSTTSRLVVGAVKNSTGSGYNHWFDGKISNPKLYNVALEPSEVRKLYNLGRTGRSMVISDTAVGIGKVPEAQLDVRGVARIDNIIQPKIPAFLVNKSLGSPSAWDTADNGVIDFGSTTINNGGCYDNTNKFTAPVNGLYFFNAKKSLNTYGANQTIRHPGLSLLKNGNTAMYMNVGVSTGSDVSSTGYTHYGVTISGVIDLLAGEYVQVNFSYDNGDPGGGTVLHYEYGQDTFSGFLIGQI